MLTAHDKLEKALRKSSRKSKKHRRDNRDSDSEYGIGLGSTRNIEINLGGTIKKTKFTPPSPIKSIPTIIASNQDDVCLTSFSNAGDIMLMAPNKSEDVHDS